MGSPPATPRSNQPHAVLPDRIETGTYAMAVAMTGGDVLLQNARPELLQAAFDVLSQTGATVTPTNEGVRIARNGSGLTAVDVTTAPFPGFPTDLQAQFMALMTRASGTSRITETIFENRFMICDSYYQAIRTATPDKIEAIDMGRRAIHNDGSRILMERLKGKVTVDLDTARRLFTLICVLHWKG